MQEERTRPASAPAEAPAGEERLTYTLNEAARRLGISRALAYEAVSRISFAGMQYRRDIALSAAEEHVRS